MQGFGKHSTPALVVGLASALLLVVYALISAGAAESGWLGMRILHVMAAGVWGGFIVFVNLVQLNALALATEAERPVIVSRIVPATSRVFTVAADATLATGLLLTVPLHSSLMVRPALLLGIAGGIAMWAIVRFVLKPNVARVTGALPVTPAERQEARARVALFARINLALLLPVTTAMLLAAHAGV